MKKSLVLATALAAFLAAPALAADPHTIAMTGHGEIRGLPDTCTVTSGVTTMAATAAAALSANTARMTSLMASLARLGVSEKNIQTLNFSVSPQYARSDNAAPQLTGYQVTNEVSIKLDDIAKLGSALDALVAAGANQMNGISFGFRDPSSLLEKARAAAVADARIRAETYARAAGLSLGPVLSISEAGGEARPLRFAQPMVLAAQAVPVAAGEESVTADVSMVWEIH